jgi:hypothetical protein
MGLRGSAAVVIWSDMPDASKHDHWHSHEHLPERAGIPGFLRSRRYADVGGAPAYFVLYEVSAAAVMTSAAYLERLNNPTAWSREIMGAVRRLNRTLVERPGLTAAHLLVRDTAQTRPETIEQTLRGKADDSIDWLVMVEGYDPSVLERLPATELSTDAIVENGGASATQAHLYRLAHLVEQNDMRD